MSLSRRIIVIHILLVQAAAFMCSPPGESPREAPEIEKPLRFINLTDLHYSSRAARDDLVMSHSISRAIPSLVAELNKRHDLDFVILTGDLTASPSHGNLEMVRDLLEPLRLPFYVIPGNHDIPAKLATRDNSYRPFSEVFQGHGPVPGQRFWSLDPEPGWHLIGLDSTIPGTWKGKVSGKQLKWLERDLKENSAKNIIVISHHNLIAHHPLDEQGLWKGYVARNAGSVRRILEAFPSVRLAVSGHHHLCAHRTWNGIPYITCPSVASWPCRYSLFQLDRNGIELTTNPIPFPDLIERARRNLLDYRPHRRLFPPGPAGEADMLRLFLGPERLSLPLTTENPSVTIE